MKKYILIGLASIVFTCAALYSHSPFLQTASLLKPVFGHNNYYMASRQWQADLKTLHCAMQFLVSTSRLPKWLQFASNSEEQSLVVSSAQARTNPMVADSDIMMPVRLGLLGKSRMERMKGINGLASAWALSPMLAAADWPAGSVYAPGRNSFGDRVDQAIAAGSDRGFLGNSARAGQRTNAARLRMKFEQAGTTATNLQGA